MASMSCIVNYRIGDDTYIHPFKFDLKFDLFIASNKLKGSNSQAVLLYSRKGESMASELNLLVPSV
jgi:hypothetical protein